MSKINAEINLTTTKEVVKPVIKELKYIGSIIPQNGHKVWEMDVETLVIKEAIFQPIDYDYTRLMIPKIKAKRKIIVTPNCIYCTALNEKNAKKVFKRNYPY